MLKRFLAILLVLLPMATLHAAMPGDTNNDGKVDATDIAYVVDTMLGISHPNMNMDAADVNGDGTINATDISFIIRSILTGPTTTLTVLDHPFAAHFLDLDQCSAFELGFDLSSGTWELPKLQVSLSANFTHKIEGGTTGSDDGAYYEITCGSSYHGGKNYASVSSSQLSSAIISLLEYKGWEIGTSGDLYWAIESLYGSMPGYYYPYLPVYFRVALESGNVVFATSSNSTVMHHVCPAFVSSKIYLVGDFNGWPSPVAGNIAPAAYPQAYGKLWILSEKPEELGSGRYYASFWLENPSGRFFRFYQYLYGWSSYGSWGSTDLDYENIGLFFENGYGSSMMHQGGMGNWYLESRDGSVLPTGWYDFEVDLTLHSLQIRNVATPTYPTNYQP